MFAKIFEQIFDSSIANDHVVRQQFMDLMVLADRNGVVDMTPEAISRRTNVPLETVVYALSELEKTDPSSRSKEEDGRRIVRLDSHRDWGWQIVNYEHYRRIQDEEARRAYFRDYKRQYRSSLKSTSCLGQSKTVSDRLRKSAMSRQAEAEADKDKVQNPSGSLRSPVRNKSSQPPKKKDQGLLSTSKRKPLKKQVRGEQLLSNNTHDNRHQPFKEQVFHQWEFFHPSTKCPWGGADAKALSDMLKASLDLTLDEFSRLLENRSRSEINISDLPRTWLRTLVKFSSGPLDRFQQPIGGTQRQL